MQREKSTFYVLNELRELAKEAERLEKLIPPISILDGYFSLVEDAAQKIQLCTSVKGINNIEFPPDIKTVIGGKQVVKNIDADITETQRAHVHAEKQVPTSEVAADRKTDKKERSPKVIVKETSVYTPKNREFEEKSSSTSLCKSNRKLLLPPVIHRLPETKILNGSVKIISENSAGSSKKLTETPVMNRTFNKLVNNAVILDSLSANKINQKSDIEEEIRITRSASKQKLEHDKDSSSSVLIRSGSKRKSSTSKSRSNKKQKTENVTKSETKSGRKPRIKRNPSKPATEILSNKMKPVIVPTMKQSTSMATSKEKQIMEEIQKKEEKANEIRKKVLAERQLKVEENKKKRNEKMEKTLQKRLQMEKEKEERLVKKDVEKKAQIDASKENVKKAKPATKSTRTKELVDQHMKENNAVLALKQNETKVDSVYKTPDRRSHSSETYDLTPAPDSSTYDFSDDEDKPSGKPIPVWAHGVHLKIALTHQYYNPLNPDEIFGTYIEAPNLTEIFGIHKKNYSKRTSSAVWHSPPDRNLHH